MKSRSRELLDRAICAMMAAIDVYNKPDFLYREEAFVILAINAWELLLKAKWLSDNGNREQSLYVRSGNKDNRRFKYKRTRSGAIMTHGIDYLSRKLVENRILNEKVRKNLEALLEFRDTATHYYYKGHQIKKNILELGIACVKNFLSAIKEWFNEDLDRFNMYVMPLALNPIHQTIAIQVSRAEEDFSRFLDSLRPDEDDPSSEYAFAVTVEVRLIRSKEKQAVPVRVTKDPYAPAVRMTEENIRERYPWDYRALTNRCRERYLDFKVNQKYHKIRKELERNQQFAHERRLDPEKPRPKKIFYSPQIIYEFDKHYQK